MTHPVPDAALDADIATVAQKGSGKSYANRGLVERLLDMRRRVVVLDPLNSWWGLKAKADGSAGYPIAVVGGPNADVPLDPARAEALAKIIAESDLSVVVDVSEMPRSALIRFATDFLAELYRVNRDPLWLVLEEADVFAPQSPAADGTRAMHDVVDQIARRGRPRGFRLWTITQRPARLSKDVLTQTSTLLLLRIRSPQDRKAAEEWIKGHAEAGHAAQIIGSLASLQVGEGYVWSPDLDLLERVRFPANRTLDTSATPKAGEQRPAIKELATTDLSVLLGAMAPGAETHGARAGPDDAALHRALNEGKQEGYQNGWNAGVEEGERRGFARAVECAQAALRGLVDPGPDEQPTSPTRHEPRKSAASRQPPAPSRAQPPSRAARPVTAASGALGLLQAAARVHPCRLTWGQIAQLAGRKPRGGHFNTSKKSTLDQGWLREVGSLVEVTDDGLAAAGVARHSGPLADIWASALPGPADKMFAALRERPGLTLTGLASVLQMQPRGGHWNSGMATLKRNGLITEDGAGRLSLAPELLEESH